MYLRRLLPLLLACIPCSLWAQAEHQHHDMAAMTPAAAPSAEQKTYQPPVPADVQTYELDELIDLAVESNPTIEQARAVIERAAAVRGQVGAYPNPTIGVSGDENAPNTTFRGGEIGMFIEQRIVTAGKLALNRDIASQEELQARAIDAAQRQRVRSSVRKLFYETLGTQWELDVQRRLSEMKQEAVRITHELANVGQADQPDVVRGEIEAQRSRLEVRQAQNKADRAWTQLALMIGQPGLEHRPLQGNLEAYPRIDREVMRETLLQDSPQVAFANAGVDRAKFALERARVEKWPDIKINGGVRDSPLLGRDGLPTGREGFFDVGIEIPIFNRNKGGVKAARADTQRATLETTRVKLELDNHLAAEYQEYQDALAVVETLRDELLPRASEAHQTYRQSFERMAAAYPQVLVAQRDLLELEMEYAEALISVWDSAIDIEGLFLSGGLDAPMAADGSADSEDFDDGNLAPAALRRHR